MSSVFEKIKEGFDGNKLWMVMNTVGFGFMGYYLYKKTQEFQELEKKTLKKAALKDMYWSANEPTNIKNIKSRKLKKKNQRMIIHDMEENKLELAIPEDYQTDSKLVEELRYIASHDYPLRRIPHLGIDQGIKSYKVIKNPLNDGTTGKLFTNKEAFVVSVAHFMNEKQFKKIKKYVRSGPKEEIYFHPSEVKALIVTCGGLCPGLNSVIRELVMTLHYNYGVNHMYGSSYGYQGMYDPKSWVNLTPQAVKNIHKYGGTILGTSRGGFDLDKIMDTLVSQGINQLYIVGGDGTHSGIYEVYREVKRRKLKISVAGIPKTIDNDIPIIDCSFGFQTAVEEAQRAIKAAWVEAHSHEYGVGLVKLMGREAGWIAMQASYAARNVNICLIPEQKFELYGPKGLYEYVYKRLKNQNKCVIVVAEGASEGCKKDLQLESTGVDKSGNPILPDIASALKKGIVKYCADKGLSITLKYIDPSYMIRTVPANASDQKMCSYISQNAVHGAMFGFTGFTNGLVNGKNCLISLEDLLADNQIKNIPKDFREWKKFLLSSGQPAFTNTLLRRRTNSFYELDEEDDSQSDEDISKLTSNITSDNLTDQVEVQQQELQQENKGA